VAIASRASFFSCVVAVASARDASLDATSFCWSVVVARVCSGMDSVYPRAIERCSADGVIHEARSELGADGIAIERLRHLSGRGEQHGGACTGREARRADLGPRSPGADTGSADTPELDVLERVSE